MNLIELLPLCPRNWCSYTHTYTSISVGFLGLSRRLPSSLIKLCRPSPLPQRETFPIKGRGASLRLNTSSRRRHQSSVILLMNFPQWASRVKRRHVTAIRSLGERQGPFARALTCRLTMVVAYYYCTNVHLSTAPRSDRIG